MSHTIKTLLAAGTLLCTFASGLANSQQQPSIDWSLDDALRQIERQADNFDSAMAGIAITRVDRSGSNIQSLEGVAFINEDGDMRIASSGEGKEVYLMDRRDLYVYKPQASIVEEYYLPRHPDRLIAHTRLGFVVTGRDLEDDYLVSSIGERFIGDRRALGLDLTPKKDKDRAVVSRVQLWIDQASWMPVQQIIESGPSGDTMTVTYTAMARNLRLNPELFKRNWPRGTKKKKM